MNESFFLFTEIDLIDGEQWKQVVLDGAELPYYVSTEGRIISTHRTKPLLLKPYNTGRGYQQVSLCFKGLRKAFYVHRLVGLLFIANPEGKAQIDHINNQKDDNRRDNLQWVSAKENIKLRDVRKEGKEKCRTEDLCIR